MSGASSLEGRTVMVVDDDRNTHMLIRGPLTRARVGRLMAAKKAGVPAIVVKPVSRERRKARASDLLAKSA
jgi:hypothetical protein